MSNPAPETFQPRAHWAPDTPWRRLCFRLRMLADLQTCTIYRDLHRVLPHWTGRLLDVGCGNSPFRHLLDERQAHYQGLDYDNAGAFGYRNPDVILYDGRVMPFADDSHDAVLCTEVLEHVSDPAPFVREIHRVLKPGGTAWITLPWSARFHYQPHDYHRYTPTMLRLIFAAFSSCEVKPRGTDLSSIASKVVVAYAGNLLRLKPTSLRALALFPFRLLSAIFALPLLAIALLAGHAGIWFGLGSADDPLGYTLILKK